MYDILAEAHLFGITLKKAPTWSVKLFSNRENHAIGVCEEMAANAENGAKCFHENLSIGASTHWIGDT